MIKKRALRKRKIVKKKVVKKVDPRSVTESVAKKESRKQVVAAWNISVEDDGTTRSSHRRRRKRKNIAQRGVRLSPSGNRRSMISGKKSKCILRELKMRVSSRERSQRNYWNS
jgi:hypothetical protein